MRRSYLLVDLFSGAGGFARGFHNTGRYEVVLAVDVDPAASKSFKANFPRALVLVEDLRKLSCRDIENLVERSEVDVLIGSPPCEPFTGANPLRKARPLDRLYADEVGSLVLEFIRVLRCLKPKAFVMENVPAMIEGELRDAVIHEFRKAGFEVYLNILRAHEFGTPSRRVRLFVSNVKFRRGGLARIVTVWEAIGDLPEPTHDSEIPNHEPPPKFGLKKLKRVSRLGWGDSLIRYEGFGGRKLPNLIKLHPHKLAPTVLGSSRFIHPFENRLLTVREQARLMGFPDDHVFLGGRDEQYNQVGEAVPPPLARALAQQLIEYIEGGGSG